MTPNPSMTGTFKMTLPSDLLNALKATPVEDPGKDLHLKAMKPSLMERVFGLFSGVSRRRD
ncbi:MAG TPA: hypothetical protein VEZ88_11690 [Steroidobacteraceae bacterium]|nr:hypothetical protein [Steroidobacteraceae bacterium]